MKFEIEIFDDLVTGLGTPTFGNQTIPRLTEDEILMMIVNSLHYLPAKVTPVKTADDPTPKLE